MIRRDKDGFSWVLANRLDARKKFARNGDLDLLRNFK